MKRNLLVIALTTGFGMLVLSSYEHGPAYEGGINRTGSQGGAAHCSGSGCHGPNSPTTLVEVKVYDAAGAAVTQYTPGANYTVAITGNNTAPGITLDEFGFQVSAVLSTSAQAGTFSVASGSHLRVTTLGGLQITEHKEALSDTFTNHFIARFSWTAPIAGSGDVSFYGILNPLGEDEHRALPRGMRQKPTDDDDDDEDEISMPNTSPVLVLSEGNGSGTNGVEGNAVASHWALYPNPCTSVLNIQIGKDADASTVNIYAVNGVKVYSAGVSSETLSIDTRDFTIGIYTAEVVRGTEKQSRSFIKQ